MQRYLLKKACFAQAVELYRKSAAKATDKRCAVIRGTVMGKGGRNKTKKKKKRGEGEQKQKIALGRNKNTPIGCGRKRKRPCYVQLCTDVLACFHQLHSSHKTFALKRQCESANPRNSCQIVLNVYSFTTERENAVVLATSLKLSKGV